MKRYKIISDFRYRDADTHFDECKKLNIPFIVIQKYKKAYRLHWDSISLGNKFCPGTDFNQQVKNTLHKYMKKRPLVCGEVGYLPGLSLDDARNAAEEIFTLFQMETEGRFINEIVH